MNTTHHPIGERTMRRTLVAAALAIACAAPQAQTWSYKEAAKPYAGTTIRVLDEITPLQEAMKTLVPQFTAETGIKVEYELLNHFEVINKGQADLLSRRGYYDAVMLHGVQMGQMLAGNALEPLDALMKDGKLMNPALDLKDLIEPANRSLTQFKGQTYGFLNWNYNMVYWARADLLNDPGEKSAFKAKYGYDLGPAKDFKQFLDIGEFFTRKAGQTLAGQPLKTDFYGILHEGITGGATLVSVWENMLKNYGGGLFDAAGVPVFDSPQNVQALTLWQRMWKYSPPGQAEYSLVDVPTVMGNGIAAQAIAYSDFVLGIDKPGASPLAGKFTYAGIPVNADHKGKRSAASEPSTIAMNRASKNKPATFLFLQWLVDKDTQRKLVEAGKGGVPIRQSTFQMPQFGGAQAAFYGAMKSTMEVAEAKPKVPKIFEIYDALGPIVQQVGQGKLTPEQGAKQGQEKMLAICKKCAL
ncbi:extracellular solute-binding protein [Aquabacterium sp. J223]|uniref:extracellular solute-binding protein n=1 Tax=Aquabacterium sp. J223 TaxID=2898431 RepID=UPI0021ADA10F|nr:extracellular solute-binding protein [Aquabacterium sp. J223]UUX96462.1 extracellular solute-binding protein [Aquabacterium sp. J223]